MLKNFSYAPQHFLPMSSWPKSSKRPGLANGWEGAAWVYLHLASKNNQNRNNKTMRSIYNKLTSVTPVIGGKKYCSLMLGFSARPLIAALAGKNDAIFAKLLPKLIKICTQRLQKQGLEVDLMLGKSGALLAFVEIETLMPGYISKTIIKNLCTDIQKIVRYELKLLSQKHHIYIGLSHGLAGYLLALEGSQTVFGMGLNSSLRKQLLHAIANERFETKGGSAVWPTFSESEPDGIQGWCHGTPGIGLVFLAGFSMTGLKEYRELADMAIEGAIRYPSGHYSFCCGLTGVAQILIEGYRITNNKRWFNRAISVAKLAAARTPRLQRKKRGFHGGEVGKFYLEQRLVNPTLPLIGLGPLSV